MQKFKVALYLNIEAIASSKVFGAITVSILLDKDIFWFSQGMQSEPKYITFHPNVRHLTKNQRNLQEKVRNQLNLKITCLQKIL